MWNERGFFTIIGLCLLLAVAISIKGVHEFENNYSFGVSNSQIEHDLQNLADSALIEAAEKIRNGDFKGEVFDIEVSSPVISKRLEKLNAAVKVRCIRRNVQDKKDSYVDERNILTPIKDSAAEDKDTILMSVARCDNEKINSADNKKGKMYRRSLAYILHENKDSEQIIHFMREFSASDRMKNRQE